MTTTAPRRRADLQAGPLGQAVRALRSESGNMMITTLMGSVVLLIVIGAIASGIGAFALLQQAVTTRSGTTNESVLTDAAFRNDVQWASSITPTDSHTVQMTVPGDDGKCRVSTWTIAPAGTQTAVQQKTVEYASADTTVNPVACAGTPTGQSVQTLVSDADPSSTFTYANAGGRELAYSAGAASLAGTDPAPAGIASSVWASQRVAAVALNTAIAASTDHRAAYRFSQAAANLSAPKTAADAASHFVPEGDLTALP